MSRSSALHLINYLSYCCAKIPDERKLKEGSSGFSVHNFRGQGTAAELAGPTDTGGTGCLLISRGLRSREQNWAE